MLGGGYYPRSAGAGRDEFSPEVHGIVEPVMQAHQYEKKPDRLFDDRALVLLPAATYSPTQFPTQYHRRYQA